MRRFPLRRSSFVVVALGALALSGCVEEGAWRWDLPEGFPEPRVLEDNPMSEAKVELGRHLFYDQQLSGNGEQACASCHFQELGFAESLAVSEGSTGEMGLRNANQLANVAYLSTLTWANPALATIEDFVPNPLFGEFPVELGVTDLNQTEVLDRFRSDASYDAMFADAFPEEDELVDWGTVRDAISSFVRTMIAGNSRYDQYTYQGDLDALTASEKRGMDLFLSEKTECHHCHGGFNFTLSTVTATSEFTEQSFHNTGLYDLGDGDYPPGNGGLYEVTGRAEDMGRFRAPPLRNVEVTGPYMHDGSMETLEEVVEFYARGGRLIEDGPYAGDGRENPYKSGFMNGFSMTTQERDDLVAFLKALTDEDFLTDERFSNPFE